MKILAETASNHNGSSNYFIDLIEKISVHKNVYITAQILKVDSFCDHTYEKYEFVKSVCLDFEEWKKIFKHCKTIGHKLIPCPCDIESLQFCIDQKFKLLKIHGSDILNVEMHKIIKKYNIKVILETQFATEKDIDLALSRIGINNIECLIHGFSNYPTEGNLVQLNSLDYMKKKWNIDVGFADHTTDTTNVPLMVLAKNATWIEKHITLSRNLRGPDWQPSLEPEEFTIMVNQIDKYSNYLGEFKKHPTSIEIDMREVMYKKYVYKNENLKVIRANNGQNYWEHCYSKFSNDNVITAIIARLKSTRLKKKVLLNFHNDAMIFDLINYVKKSTASKKTILATSFLDQDLELINEAKKRDVSVFAGEPENVTKRLLDLAEQEKSSAIFRITGDMPFADPTLMDKMNNLRKLHELDYVRALNFPLGMSAELYSIKYLNKLYLETQNPNESEYLGWFVILDKNARKGSVNVEYNDMKLDEYSLTVDYKEDLDACKNLLKKIGKDNINDICLIDILSNIDLLQKVNINKEIKLPHETTMKYYEYLKLQKNQGFIVNEIYKINF